jgi:hypothetical protein
MWAWRCLVPCASHGCGVAGQGALSLYRAEGEWAAHKYVLRKGREAFCATADPTRRLNMAARMVYDVKGSQEIRERGTNIATKSRKLFSFFSPNFYEFSVVVFPTY